MISVVYFINFFVELLLYIIDIFDEKYNLKLVLWLNIYVFYMMNFKGYILIEEKEFLLVLEL